MKSIKQQYIDLREGNMSQANFMRNLRMSLPQFVTNVTSFDDSVRILKNKGILTEADIKMIAIEKEDIEDNINTEEETSENDMLDNISIGGAEISNRANPKDGFSLGFFEEGLDESADVDLDTLVDELDATQKETIMSIIKKMLRKGANKLNTSIPLGAPINPKDEFDLGYDTMSNIFESINEAVSDDEIMKKYNEMFGKNPQTKFADVAKALNIPEDQVSAALQMGSMPKFGLRENKLTISGTDKAIKMLKSELRNNNVKFETKENKVMVDDSPKAKMAIKMVKEREGMQSIKLSENKKALKENKDEKGKWTNTSGKSMYDQFKEIDNLNAQEVTQGIDWEMQCHPDMPKKDIIKIVIKNLKKNPIYYTMWDLSGVEGAEAEYMSKSSKPEDWQMQPLDKNMSNVVDKKMGMQPVKDIEKPKKDSDKGGETNKMVKGVELMSLIAKTVRGMQKMDATGEKMKKISVREGMEVGDKVKVDPEEIDSINKPNKQVYSLPHISKLDTKETYTIKSISGKDAELVDSKGKKAGYLNMSSLIKSIDENDDREKYRKDYNAKAQASDAEQAKKDAEKFKKDSETQLKAATGSTTDAALASFPGLRERLKDMIRKELKETAGAYGYGDAMSVDEVDIYGIAGNPEEEMAARMARRPMDKYEPLSITKTDRDRSLDDMLEDAEYNIDNVVSQVGNDVKLGIALLSRAREIKPSLVPGLRQALNLYNK